MRVAADGPGEAEMSVPTDVDEAGEAALERAIGMFHTGSIVGWRATGESAVNGWQINDE